MSHYEFLKLLAKDGLVYIHQPIWYDEDSFSVMVEDEYNTVDFWFDKNGNVKEDML